ncbi:hypothetical protein HDG35_003697 [Paraburkholderia sp. JPY681]|nr:hypothetical protein [Paraburkholderia atlantica]
MATHPPYSVVLTYTEDRQRLAVQTVDAASLAPLLAGKSECRSFSRNVISNSTKNFRGGSVSHY